MVVINKETADSEPSPSVREKGWITIRSECPVEVFPHRMFHEAKLLERELDSIQRNIASDQALQKTLSAKTDLSDIINQIKRSTDPKYEAATEYESAAKAFYRLIDMNLRFYKYAEIEKNLDGAIQNNGFNEGKLNEVVESLQRLLNFIKRSIEKANYKYYDEPEDEREDKSQVVYIVLFAQQLEASLRYTAKYKNQVTEDGEGDDGNNIQDYYAIIESARASDAVNQAEENNVGEELNEEAEEELEDLFEQEEGVP